MKRLKTLLRFNEVSGLLIHVALLLVISLLSFSYPLFIIPSIFYTLYIFKKNKILGIYALAITLLVIASFFINYYIFTSYNSNDLIEGVITYKDEKYLLIKEGTHYIRAYTNNTNLYKIGSRVMISHTPIEINERSIENTFSLYKYRMYKRIYLFTKIDKIEVVKESFNLYTLKRYLIEYIDKNYSNISSSYIKELLLGVSTIDEEVTFSASSIGIIHLFVISGLHINIIKKGLSKFLSLFNIPLEIITIFIDIILVIYLLISSFSVAILRVVILSVIESIYKLKGEEHYKIDSLSVALILVLLINPFSIFESGFYLTFISTLVIMLLEKKNPLMVSLSVLSFSIPILLYFNSGISVLIIPLTLLFGVIFTHLLIPFTYLILFLPLLDFIYSYLVTGLSEILLLINSINTTFNYSINSPYILFLLVGLVFMIYALKENKHKVIIGIFTLLLLMLNLFCIRYEVIPSVKVFDVGQGDSILIRDGFNTVLIDTGDKDNYNTVVKYLKSENITRISGFFLSHKDSDHYALYEAILDNFYVEEVHMYEGNTSYKYGHIYIKTYSCGSAKSDNDKSMVMYVRIYNTTFLFTGDIEKEGEDYLYAKNISNIDYLKAAHHGSASSSNPYLINKLNPKVALISCGLNNRYNHPSIEAIKTLNEVGSIIYRTDKMGSINIKVFPKFSIIDTYRKQELFWFMRHKYLRFLS